jgi:hypothetical protein
MSSAALVPAVLQFRLAALPSAGVLWEPCGSCSWYAAGPSQQLWHLAFESVRVRACSAGLSSAQSLVEVTQ